MKTKGEEMLGAVQGAIQELNRLKGQSYRRNDISNILEPLSSRIELYLKSTVIPASSKKDKFAHLINKLTLLGVDRKSTDRLHAIRNEYNKSKHDPTAELVLIEVINAVKGVTESIEETIRLNIGSVSSPTETRIKYHLIIAAWDHYIHGDTEISIMIEGNGPLGAIGINNFNIKIKDWDTIIKLLRSYPNFHYGKAHYEQKLWDSFENEGDFIGGGVWDGDYRELIIILSQFHWHDLDQQLLPGLRRSDQYFSVGTSVIMAAVDIATSEVVRPSADDLHEKIMKRCELEYAMSPKNGLVAACSRQISTVITSIDFSKWKHINGPLLIRGDHVKSKNIIKPQHPLHLFIDDDSLGLIC